ncbi:YppG family protein [Bacillaceae bacterium W0354]
MYPQNNYQYDQCFAQYPYFSPSYPYNNNYGMNYMNNPYMNNGTARYFNQYFPNNPYDEFGSDAYNDWQEYTENNQTPFIRYFQDENGEIDIDKVFLTVNQVMKTAHQVGPIVRTVNNFVKNLK